MEEGSRREKRARIIHLPHRQTACVLNHAKITGSKPGRRTGRVGELVCTWV